MLNNDIDVANFTDDVFLDRFNRYCKLYLNSFIFNIIKILIMVINNTFNDISRNCGVTALVNAIL